MSQKGSTDNCQQPSYFSQMPLSPLIGNTLANILDETAAKYPQKEALVFYNEKGSRASVTYEKLQSDSSNLAAYMLQLGCVRGDMIGTMLRDPINYYIARFALHRIGANVCLMSEDVKANQSQIDRIGCVGVVVESDQDLDNDVKYLLTTWSSCLKFVICTTNINIEGVQMLYDCINHGRLLDKEPVALAQQRVDMDDDAFIFFTSGTTGDPKLVQYSHFSALNVAKSILERAGADSTCVLFNDRIPRTAAGTVLGFLDCCLGTAIVSMEYTMYWHHKDKYIPLLLDILSKEKVTHAFLMQHHMHDIINIQDRDMLKFSCLKYILTGGQPMTPELGECMQKAFPKIPVLQIYGASEAFVSADPFESFVSTDLGKSQSGKHVGTVGKVLSGVEVKIIDKDGSIVPMGSHGEICVRGLHSFKWYHGDRELTAKVLRNGWYHTNDLGFLQQDGYVTVQGRKSDVIKCVGEKVYPSYVESMISKYKGIHQAIVVGITDARLGQAVCACILPEENFIEKDFMSWCDTQFDKDLRGRAAMPKYTCIMSEFPMIGFGKVDRKAVRRFAVKELNILE